MTEKLDQFPSMPRVFGFPPRSIFPVLLQRGLTLQHCVFTVLELYQLETW